MSYLRGMDAVIAKLNKEIKAIEGRTMAGLVRSAILVRRSMDEVPPLIPVDTDNLRLSWDASKAGFVNGNPFIRLGFSANYATYVHEMLGTKTGGKVNWKRPGSGPKFFQAALYRNKKAILDIIREEARIK